MDREAWLVTVHGVAKNWTQLSDQAQHSLNKARVFQQTLGLASCDRSSESHSSSPTLHWFKQSQDCPDSQEEESDSTSW